MSGAWGILPVAIVLLGFVTRRLTALVLCDQAPRTDRAAGAVVIAMVIVHLSVGWLAQFGLLSPLALMTVLLLLSLLALSTTPRGQPLRLSLSREALAPIFAIVGVTGLAIATARIVLIWQWDSLGYHLPFAQFVLQSGSFSAVPNDVRYISTYPHNIEFAIIWLRAMLPDDRLVDLVQIPFGVGGAVVLAATARRLGASQTWSLLAALCWLCAPGVFLQLPTDYVDVATATALLAALYFSVLSAPTRRNLIFGGIALGLFLGCKPSSPLAAAAMTALVLARTFRAKQWSGLALFCAGTLVFGAEMYAVMLLRHGYPVWPVELHLGPFTLPGLQSVDTLLATASAVPRAEGGTLLERLSRPRPRGMSSPSPRWSSRSQPSNGRGCRAWPASLRQVW